MPSTTETRLLGASIEATRSAVKAIFKGGGYFRVAGGDHACSGLVGTRGELFVPMFNFSLKWRVADRGVEMTASVGGVIGTRKVCLELLDAVENRLFEIKHAKRVIAAKEQIPELAATVLSRTGWKIKFVNIAMRQIAAYEIRDELVDVTQMKILDLDDQKPDPYATDPSKDREKRKRVRLSFQALVRWQADGDGNEVAISVSEEHGKWGVLCRERCQKFLQAFETDSGEQVDVSAANKFGTAKWAEANELKQADYIGSYLDHRRFLLGKAENGEFISVPPNETIRHATVCGPTGSGKTSSIFIPNLIERTDVSAIITEATAGDEPPDLFLKTSGYRKEKGHKIYKFNPDDLSSHRINPLDGITTYDQASQVANIIIENTSGKFSGDPKIWENSERQLLISLIMHVTAKKGDLGSIRRLIRQDPEELKRQLMNSPILETREEYWGFYSNSTEGFRHGVTAGLMNRLNLWMNPKIVALTETTDFPTLDDELFSFYLSVPAHRTDLKPLAALVLNFIFNMALERKFKHPLALFLDEFTNYGFVPGLAEKLTIIRHRAIPATLGFQDYVQLEKVYSKHDALLLFGQPATRIFFKPNLLDTAKRISESLGTQTIVERQISSSGQIQEKETKRELMLPGEVLSLKKQLAIAFTPETNPIQLKTFSWMDYEDKTKLPAISLRKIEVNEKLIRICEETAAEPTWETEYKKKPKLKTKNNKPKNDDDDYPEV